MSDLYDELQFDLTLGNGKEISAWKDRENNLWYQVGGDGTGYETLDKLMKKAVPEEELKYEEEIESED